MLSGWRRQNGAPRIGQTRFQSRTLLQVERLSLPAIRLILVDRSEISFLSHCLPSPFSVTEANGSQVEFVPWRFQKEKALSLPLLVRMHPRGDRWPHNASNFDLLWALHLSVIYIGQTYKLP